MSTRITNSIINNNALYNTNALKREEDRLYTLGTTGKKITKPSDDPVVAIRSLRLGAARSETEQYADRNTRDAESWLELTEGSVSTVVTALTDMIEQCQKGANGDYTVTNRKAVMQALESLKNEIYASSQTDYAGRYVFSGLRTDTQVLFEKDTDLKYTITEPIKGSGAEAFTWVNTQKAETINTGNYDDAACRLDENEITGNTLYRVRLAYDALDGTDGGNTDAALTFWENGMQKSISCITMASSNVPSPYEQMLNSTDSEAAIFVRDTGELLLSEELHKRMLSLRDDPFTSDIDESLMNIRYSKTEWKKGELRPEHYFECESTISKNNVPQPVVYNEGCAKTGLLDQYMNYNVGYNQVVQVNVLAGEVFSHDIGRDVDELGRALEQYSQLEDTATALAELDEDNAADPTLLKDQKDAVSKALDLYRDKLQSMFENAITRMQEHLDTATAALASVGAKRSRVQLVQGRLDDQKSNLENLQADNEEGEFEETATKLESARLAYDAALMATAKITQSTLIDYL